MLISARINVMIQNEIQADIFEKIIHTEWKELKDFRSGDLLNRLSNDAVQVASSVISWIPNCITKLVQFAGAFVIIFHYDPVMSGIDLLSAPVTFLIYRKLMIKMINYNTFYDKPKAISVLFPIFSDMPYIIFKKR